uniref:Polyprotein n=1 Tax=Haemonchus placei TaxID=6290 RepID=A0A0N4WAR7_HAEPC
YRIWTTRDRGVLEEAEQCVGAAINVDVSTYDVKESLSGRTAQFPGNTNLCKWLPSQQLCCSETVHLTNILRI